MQVQGTLSAPIAPLIRECIAKPGPPTAAHQPEEPHAPWGISALEELVISKVAQSLPADTVLQRLRRRMARFARWDSGAREA